MQCQCPIQRQICKNTVKGGAISGGLRQIGRDHMYDFDANCMKIGFLVFKILQFYVFKMTTNGVRHFEMPLKLKIIKLYLFLKTMRQHSQFTKVIFVFM